MVAGYFGQVLQQSQQLKEVNALVGLFSLLLCASDKAEGCDTLTKILSENLNIFHLTGQD